jgi:hypothetical protein
MKGITALFGAVGLAATMAVGTASAQQQNFQAQIEDWDDTGCDYQSYRVGLVRGRPVF